MPAITTPANIPAAARPKVKAVCLAIGPALLGDRFPQDENGAPKTDLTATEVGQVFEAVTREFWRQQVQAHEAQAAAEAARIAAVEANAADPFGV